MSKEIDMKDNFKVSEDVRLFSIDLKTKRFILIMKMIKKSKLILFYYISYERIKMSYEDKFIVDDTF